MPDQVARVSVLVTGSSTKVAMGALCVLADPEQAYEVERLTSDGEWVADDGRTPSIAFCYQDFWGVPRGVALELWSAEYRRAVSRAAVRWSAGNAAPDGAAVAAESEDRAAPMGEPNRHPFEELVRWAHSPDRAGKKE